MGKAIQWLKELMGLGTDSRAQQSSKTNIERAPRVHIEALHHVTYNPKNPPFADRIRLNNLSLSGMGLQRDDARSWPELGQQIDGFIQFDGVDYKQKIQLVRQSTNTVGARFVDLDLNIKSLIRKYFEAELAALSLHEVSQKFLAPAPGYRNRWIQGDACELFFSEDSQGLHSFSMLIFGTIIEFNRNSGLRTGLLNSKTYLEPSGRSREADIFWDSYVNDETRDLGQRFLSNIQVISAADRQKLASLIKT